jgi:hypothetical protein
MAGDAIVHRQVDLGSLRRTDAFTDGAVTGLTLNLTGDHMRLMRKEHVFRQTIQPAPTHLFAARGILPYLFLLSGLAEWGLMTKHARLEFRLSRNGRFLDGVVATGAHDFFLKVFLVIEGERLNDRRSVRLGNDQDGQRQYHHSYQSYDNGDDDGAFHNLSPVLFPRRQRDCLLLPGTLSPKAESIATER